MRSSRLRFWTRLTAFLAVLVLAGCAAQQVHRDGLRLLAEGNRDAALIKLREASQLDPNSSEYRIVLLNQTQSYSRELLERADAARLSGRTDDAAQLYGKALQIDPGNDRARRGLVNLELDARSEKLLADSERLLGEGNLRAAQERVEAALADNPANPAAKRQSGRVRDALEKLQRTRAADEAARSVLNKPVTLQFRDANLRMVFEALSRTTGLNVILDRDVRADLKTTIFVKDAAVEDTLDLILLQNQLEKRSLNANTLFIYPATPAKQREYQDLQVRTFQVANSDVKYLQSVLKSLLKAKDVSVDERSGTLVMRDTADAIAVASKIIAAHDVPEPEVMLQVEVLQVSRSRLSNLGVKLPTFLGVATPDSAKTVGAMRNLTRNDLTLTPLSLGLNLQLQDSDANLLASPRIRARNKEKAKILIGDRVPIITNTVTPVSSGGSVVTGSVQYQDVGLKLEFEPQVYSDSEVGIRLSLEVSNIVKEIPGPNGSLAYQIGTRTAQTVLRLLDGETQVLGGLIQDDDRNTSDRLPGLGHLPMVGRLFGNNNSGNTKNEILLSITPHIVRPPALIDNSLRTLFSGTESSVRERALSLNPIGIPQTGAAKPETSGGRVRAATPAATGAATPGAQAPAAADDKGTVPVPAMATAPSPAAGPSLAARRRLPAVPGAMPIAPASLPAPAETVPNEQALPAAPPASGATGATGEAKAP